MNSLYNAVVDNDQRESDLITEIKNTNCKSSCDIKAVYRELIANYLGGI